MRCSPILAVRDRPPRRSHSRSAQAPGTHSLYPHVNHAVPGQIGRLQLNRGPAVNSYVQPIEIKAAPWLMIAWADHGDFSPFRPAPVTLGLLVSPVYRFKVMGIPGNETATVYPTIEVIDRLYPPPGQAAKHPIPIEITVEDLRLALAGQFVTRVIYVEDPDQALPYVSDPDRPWYDAGSTSNPLNEADKLGRPSRFCASAVVSPMIAMVPTWRSSTAAHRWWSMPRRTCHPCKSR